MLTLEWLAAVKAAEEAWRGQLCGIAYTQSFFRSPDEIWYDRLGTDVPAYIAGGLAKIGADSIYLNVEQALELCLEPHRRSKLAAIFNVCLGHKSLDNWALVPAAASWAGLPILPNGAHASVLGEDKRVAKDFAVRAGLVTPDMASEAGSKPAAYIRKPRGWGSSIGLTIVEESGAYDPEWIVEPFIPGYDLTVTLLHDPSREALCPVGALFVDHRTDDPRHSVWSKDKKSGGSLSGTLQRSFHEIDEDLGSAIGAFAADLGLRSAARVDFRMPARPSAERIGLREVVFLEVNPCPTLSAAASFGRTISFSLQRADTRNFYFDEASDRSDAFAIAALLSSINAK